MILLHRRKELRLFSRTRVGDVDPLEWEDALGPRIELVVMGENEGDEIVTVDEAEVGLGFGEIGSGGCEGAQGDKETVLNGVELSDKLLVDQAFA